jgi:DNA-binding NtrC family response regulator
LPSHSHRVLLVEDDHEIGEAFAWILRSKRFGVERVSSAEEGLAALAGDPDGYCLAFVDLRMPGMGGIGFLRARQKNPRIAHVPVVITSGEVTRRSEAFQLGVCSFLMKPVDPEELIEAVSRHCARRGKGKS